MVRHRRVDDLADGVDGLRAYLRSRILDADDLDACITRIQAVMDGTYRYRANRISDFAQAGGTALPELTIETWLPNFLASKAKTKDVRNGFTVLIREVSALTPRLRGEIGLAAFDGAKAAGPYAGDWLQALLEKVLADIQARTAPSFLSKAADRKRALAGLRLLIRDLPPRARDAVGLAAHGAAKAAGPDAGNALLALLSKLRDDVQAGIDRHSGKGPASDRMPSSSYELRQVARLASIVIILSSYDVPLGSGGNSILVRVCAWAGVSRRTIVARLPSIKRDLPSLTAALLGTPEESPPPVG